MTSDHHWPRQRLMTIEAILVSQAETLVARIIPKQFVTNGPTSYRYGAPLLVPHLTAAPPSCPRPGSVFHAGVVPCKALDCGHASDIVWMPDSIARHRYRPVDPLKHSIGPEVIEAVLQ